MRRWIYFRAKTVVVWLGRKYERFGLQTKIQRTNIQDISQTGPQIVEPGLGLILASEQLLPLPLETGGSFKGTAEEQEMVAELRGDRYWDRVWIIQELGRANQIKVCFGHDSAMGWTQFIALITLHNSGSEGPLMINRLLQEKYSGSHTLRKLLEDHRKALCQEPRDKIYGLVGLAADAIRFPMDYGRSLADVWKDTMVFMNSRKLLPEPNIYHLGVL